MKLYITRHSKTIWNQEHRLQGWLDSSLTLQGKQDALALKKRLQEMTIDVCYSSPIGRAKQTTNLLFENTKIIYDNRLKEMNFGDYEGKYVKDLLKKEDYYNLWHHPYDTLHLPNGETLLEVRQRVQACIQDIYQAHPHDTVFLTIHGMLFIILRSIIENVEIKDITSINTVVRGCSLSEVDFDGKTFTIHYLGDDSHLPTNEEPIQYAK